MKRIGIFIFCAMFFFTGCGKDTGVSEERNNVAMVEIGVIGDNQPIERRMVAKMVALAFYDMDAIRGLENKLIFSDVSDTDWSYLYINAAVHLGFLSGDGDEFRPEDSLTLSEAQVMLDRLAPDYENSIVLKDENKDMPVSYRLWMQLFETALKERRGEESLYSYGIEEIEEILLYSGAGDHIFDRHILQADGYNLEEFEDVELRFWKKGTEILGLLAVTNTSPTFENIYTKKDGEVLTVITGSAEKEYWYYNQGNYDRADICNVTIEGAQVKQVVCGEKITAPIIRRVNDMEIYLDGLGVLPWADGARVYGRNMEIQTSRSLIVGTDLADIYILDGEVMAAVIVRDVFPQRIGVLLFEGMGFDSVQIGGSAPITLKNVVAEKTFLPGEEIELSKDLPWFDHGILMVTGDDMRLTLSDGTVRSYTDTLFLERRGERIYFVNELDMEEYLVGVVPNEMPVGFGEVALEVQAISSRSYAFNQFYQNTYSGYGAHITDSTASQVFLGTNTIGAARRAVENTAGLGIVANGKVAQTFFYSTSSGFGANSSDVWTEDGLFQGEQKSYLVSRSYTEAEEPQTEEGWMEFWQNTEIRGYDMDSPWYRWKVYFGAGQLSEILKQTLAEVAQGEPHLVLIFDEEGTWKQGVPGDMGRLTGIEMAKRGAGGVGMILELQFERGRVQVISENAIRKVLSPTKITIGEDIYLQRIDGESIVGQAMLPSGFFAINEMRNEEGTLTGVALYGGGFGHGVGMSQYGVGYLAREGRTAEEIIKVYYTGVQVDKIL